MDRVSILDFPLGSQWCSGSDYVSLLFLLSRGRGGVVVETLLDRRPKLQASLKGLAQVQMPAG